LLGNQQTNNLLSNINGSAAGVTLISKNATTYNEGSVAYITSNYNTGYMVGDIRGAWNVDTDVTSLSGSNKVSSSAASDDTNSTTDFVSKNSATFSVNTNSTYVSSGTRSLYVNCTNAASGVKYWKTGGLTVGKSYVLSGQLIASNGSSARKVQFYAGGYDGSSAYGSRVGYCSVADVWNSFSMSFVAVTANFSVVFTEQGSSNDTDFYIDEFSVREAIPDRSVKGNGLAVYGTPTVSAVATGAELKCISGFSTTAGYTANGTRLQQPYNSDLDFTGDWEISGWINGAPSGDISIHWSDASGNNGWMLYHNASTSYFIDGTWDSYSSYMQTNSISILQSRWIKFSYVCKSGTLQYYLDGQAVTNSTNTKDISAWTLTNTSAHQLAIYAGNTGHKFSLIRISATAPSAEQIKDIYEAEKPLFQDGAKCTLNGSSDSVTAMSYDDSNDELLVGTSGGLSVFKGLRRVDENTNAITEVAQQGGLRVEEY